MTKINFVYFFLLILPASGYGQALYNAYFKEFGVQGSTTIYDYKNKKWLFTDSADAHRLSLPASTFKILNSLLALEMKVINSTDEVIKWDGEDKKLFGKTVPAWNHDTDLRSAYANSTIWFYVELAKRIGRPRYHRFLKKIGYGNGDLSEKGTDFWNYGQFGISPVNQIDFLVNLYENKLPFSQKTMDTVKTIMFSETVDGITFRDKTGWTRKNGKDIGWWVGYAQTESNVYFFATRLSKDVEFDNPDFAASRKAITKRILHELIQDN